MGGLQRPGICSVRGSYVDKGFMGEKGRRQRGVRMEAWVGEGEKVRMFVGPWVQVEAREILWVEVRLEMREMVWVQL